MDVLLPSEKKFLARGLTAEVIRERKADAQAKLDAHLKLPQARHDTPGAYVQYFQHELMYKTHPEALEWEKTPQQVLDPNELVEAIWFGGSEPLGVKVPMTNAHRLHELRNVWCNQQLPKKEVPEYAAFCKWESKRSALRDAIYAADHDLAELERLTKQLAAPALPVAETVVPFLDRLLEPAAPKGSKRRREETTDDEDDTDVNAPAKIKGITIPYSKGGRLQLEKRTEEDGGGFVFTERTKLKAVLRPPASLWARDPQQMEWLPEALNEMAADPKAFFGKRGKTYGLCMLCGRSLTDERSKHQGYGPTCARYIS